MLKKSMLLLVALLALGCGEEKGEDSSRDNDEGSKAPKDASTNDARGSANPDEEIEGDADASSEEQTESDAGQTTVQTPDGGANDMTGNDGGPAVGAMGSCCSEHDTPGCNNPDLMICVCSKNDKCCTDKWTKECAFIVTSRWCQEGVRDCVCNPGGPVERQDCCLEEWTSSCDTLGKLKCDLVPGCF